jgi:glycosyltransferase involved in cell wall biosynthesis
LFDLRAVMKEYFIVLEPCWAGYCDPSILMFAAGEREVLVQSPEPSDHSFIEELSRNLVAVPLGASDWVDKDLFEGAVADKRAKRYDLVMVGHWGRQKNHRELFRALARVERRPLSILLVGFPWAGRSSADIENEIEREGLNGVSFEIRESVPAIEVARYLSESKVFLLLAEKEGANKAVVEAMFSNVPAIVYEGFIGGAANKINTQTGILTSFAKLPIAIERMLSTYDSFTPRAWALANTGSRNATFKLNANLRSLAEARGERWTTDIVEKVNKPNLAYKDPNAVPPSWTGDISLNRYLRREHALD